MPLQWRNQIWQSWRKVPESDARSVGHHAMLAHMEDTQTISLEGLQDNRTRVNSLDNNLYGYCQLHRQ